jgi:hypothetical protein
MNKRVDMSVFMLTLFFTVSGILLFIYFRFLVKHCRVSKGLKKTKVRKDCTYLRTGRGYIKRRMGLLSDEIDDVSSTVKDIRRTSNER